jgi:hypothetical protein
MLKVRRQTYFLFMMILHKSFYLFICLWIYQTNAETPIEQVMNKLIKLISEEQVIEKKKILGNRFN